MADNDNGTKSLVKAEPKPDLGIQEFGSREDIIALGARIRAMMPGGQSLSNEQAMAAAQYALTLGANPFRGEIYAYEDRGQLQIVEGYKLLVRWAKAKCDYSEWFEPLTEGLRDGDVGFRCYILRQDKQSFLDTLLKGGMELDRAMDIVTVNAGGVVRAEEMVYRSDSKYHKRGDPLDPPTGWTWHDVARKRALKNALNKSHGVPSLADIAHESWNVEGVQTRPEDWEDVRAEMLPAEAEATAEYSARLRQIHEREPTVENAAEAAADLFGDGAGAAFSEGEFTEADAPVHGEPAEPPLEEPESEPGGTATTNGERPYAPEAIKAKLAKVVEAGSGAPAGKDERAFVNRKLEECFAGDEDSGDKAADVVRYLFEVEPLGIKQSHVEALKRWLLQAQQPDDTGDYPLHEAASAEAAAIIDAVDAESVQQGALEF